MWLLILEALAAGALLVFFVWWTMFSGRRPEQDSADRPADHPTDVSGDARDDDPPR